MSELIDREALLDECLNHYEVGNIEQNCTMDWICKTVRNFPAAPRWVRCEEPPQSGQECFTAYRSILRSDPEWLYDICYYTDDLARDCPLMDDAEHRPGWYRYVSEYGDVECHPKYWMAIEPPKEDE